MFVVVGHVLVQIKDRNGLNVKVVFIILVLTIIPVKEEGSDKVLLPIILQKTLKIV